ncbi:hypothetical protein CDD82_5768 [Ophiocordyceps australis]|uniref:RAVE complex protein Rav1 C-terminal domain-containing protein n=1 Tax=Ophiocordyceps australis TaxID=1399860 RepID=A0A2C5YZE3_9HYPO|nr:hypothetical protein CDD82_5768 [Ophiocordyceps australis]
MITVLPGRAQSRLQALVTCCWNGRQYNVRIACALALRQQRQAGLTAGGLKQAYITGSAFTIIDGAGSSILQTVYGHDDDDELQAIAMDETTGKIATCTLREVCIFKATASACANGTPRSADAEQQWAQESSFEIPNHHVDPQAPLCCPCLSWGSSEELLVASKRLLSLFATARARPVCCWSKSLASPVKAALVSPDSAYIASIGFTDPLPKIWRRLSYGSDDVRFDVSYLEHPDIVTSLRWRRPPRIHQASDNVLYSVCIDRSMRIWVPTETSDGHHWQLWGRLDLSPSPRLLCILDGRDLTTCVERIISKKLIGPAGCDKLVSIAQTNPEMCLTMDSNGILTVWVLENVCRGSTNNKSGVYRAAQVRYKKLESMPGLFGPGVKLHAEAQCYYNDTDGQLRILVHVFDGRIGVFVSNMMLLMDPGAKSDECISLQTVWSGHSKSVRKLVRDFSGKTVVSRTADGECIVWRHDISAPNLMARAAVMAERRHIHRICPLHKGRFVVLLLREGLLTLWDCSTVVASLLAECRSDLTGTPLCLILLPRQKSGQSRTRAHLATITSQRQGIVWQVDVPCWTARPDLDSTAASGPEQGAASLREFCRFELAMAEAPMYVLPVDPAGSSPATSGFLDVFARDVAVSYTCAGRVDFWTARIDLERRGVDWLSTCYTETGLDNPALASGSMLKKAAVVNQSRSRVTIWDVGGARLEYDAYYEQQDQVRDLDWTSTPDAQSILAIGFQYRVVLLSQMRFDYLNRGPAWAPIRDIDVGLLTPHGIGDSTWLTNGHLVVGAGNQLFVYDRRAGSSTSLLSAAGARLSQSKNRSWDLFEAVQRFNGPMPVFHPQFVSQCILAGKSDLVRRILVALHKTLKYLVPGETVDNYLGLDLCDFYQATPTSQGLALHQDKNPLLFQAGSANDDDETDKDQDSFTEQTATLINEKLLKVGIPQLSGLEQMQLADTVECVAYAERHRRAMDENGARFMVLYRQHALRKGHAGDKYISWREINWAFHSGSQDMLAGFVTRQAHGDFLWENARESGIFMWLTDAEALRSKFEMVARNEYTKGDTKNPVDCSLFYLALGKKTVLQGLWRMASWNKEQAATQRLLSNDFEDAKWQRAALKNAYALLSKRRFEYAAAFFILAGNLQDAVEVCVRQLKDMQLAIALARVNQGDGGPVLRKLLEEAVLPEAAQQGNRWLASWAFWMLGRKDMAVRALIMPVFSLLETPTPSGPDMKSRLFLTDDPALVVLYSQLRQQTLQTLRGASKVTPRAEWAFVLDSAKLYDRMGCDLLGLDLVRNWEFQRPTSVDGINGGETNPLKLLRRRSSLVVDDMAPMHRHVSSTMAKDKDKAPATFEEPDAASLLDSFGL